MPVDIKGITIDFKANTTQLDKAFRALNQEAGKVQRELNAINRGLKMNPGSVTLAEQKTKLLGKAVKETEIKQKELQRAMKAANADKNVDKNSASYRKLQRELDATNYKLKALKKEQLAWTASQSKIGKMSTAMTAFGQKASAAAGKMKYLSMAAAGIGAAALKVTMNFDEGMSKVQAVTGATGDELLSLRNKAKEMGATTKFSATQATEAMNYMAMAGWKTEDMLSGISGVMNLAAASGEDLATTSDIVTDALTAFGLEAADSGMFADTLAAAAANANTNVAMMGETFKYAAPIAGSMGYNVKDIAHSIGLMGNAGIKSSQAGTSLRRIMTSLTKDFKVTGKNIGETTVKVTKADGSMRDWSDIIADTRQAFKGLTKSEKTAAAESLVGKNAMSGFLAIMNASEKDVKKLDKALNNSSGAAAEMAAIMQDNTAGSITILKSTLESAAISIGETLAPTLTKVVEEVQKFVEKFNDLSPATKDMIGKLILFTAAATPALSVVGGMSRGIGGLLKPISLFATKTSIGSSAVGKLSGALKFLVNPATAAIGAMAALGVVAVAQNSKLTEATRLQRENAQARRESAKEIETEAAMADTYKEKLNELMKKENKSKEDKLLIKEYVHLLNEEVGDLNLKYDEEKDKLNKTSDAIDNKIKKMQEMARAKVYEENYTKALRDQIDAEKSLGEEEKKLQELKDIAKQKEKEGYSGDALLKYTSDIAKQEQVVRDHEKALKDDREEAKYWQDQMVGAQTKTENLSKKVQYGTKAFEKLTKNAGVAGHTFSKVLVKGFKEGSIKVPETVKEMKRAVKFDSLYQKAREAGVRIPNRLANGVIQGSKSFDEVNAYVRRMTKFNKLEEKAEKAGIKIPKDLKRGVKNGKTKLSEIDDYINRHVTWNKIEKKARAKGVKLDNRFKRGVIDGKTSLKEAEKYIEDHVEEGIDPDTKPIGEDATAGVASGMTSPNALSWLSTACAEIGGWAYKKIKKALNINSPSKVMLPLGAGITEGLAKGMVDSKGLLTNASNELKNTLAATSYTSAFATSGINASQVITPHTSKTTTININNTISGATDPGAYASELARQIKLQLRTV